MKVTDFPRGIAVITTPEGEGVAERVAKAFNNAYFLGHYSRESLRKALECYDALVLVMSLGGAFRILCESLKEKGEGPAVVVVDPLGKYAIPVVNSHWGANDLAEELGERLGLAPVITTVAERKGLRPLEDLARLTYSELRPKELIVKYYSRILKGEKVCLEGIEPPEGFDYLVKGSNCELKVTFGKCEEGGLCLKPYDLYVGIGAKREASELTERVLSLMNELMVPKERVRAIGSVRESVREVAEKLGVSFRLFAFDELRDFRNDCMSPPSRTLDSLGLPGVAEAIALAMAGPNGKLLVRKVREGDFTLAIAGVAS
ncbi:MAG: cobalamin biosynthesis protein [Thermoprotei archaeon]